MKRRLGVIMDPIQGIQYHKDTTLALLWAARDYGYELFYMEQADLYLVDGRIQARMRELSVFEDPVRWFELGDPLEMPLSGLDVVLMRKDPPFDMAYIYTTYLLEMAEQEGLVVANKPSGLRECNEKLFASHFPQCSPPLLVSSQAAPIRRFAAQQGDVVLKPLDGMGGEGVFRVLAGDPNLGVIIETLTRRGRLPIMVQRYLPEIAQGDKRILMIDGEPAPYCLARVPQAGEARGNLAAGGKGVVQALTDRDRWIAAQVGPELRRRGLWFVGLDVIGDYLTEVNVTSPTCLREIESEHALGIAHQFIAALDKQLARRRDK